MFLLYFIKTQVIVLSIKKPLNFAHGVSKQPNLTITKLCLLWQKYSSNANIINGKCNYFFEHSISYCVCFVLCLRTASLVKNACPRAVYCFNKHTVTQNSLIKCSVSTGLSLKGLVIWNYTIWLKILKSSNYISMHRSHILVCFKHKL